MRRVIVCLERFAIAHRQFLARWGSQPMKWTTYAMGAAALAWLVAAIPAHSGEHEKAIFSCSFGAKAAYVTYARKKYTYNFGTKSHTEFSITSDQKSQNVFYREDQYAGLVQQLRFTNGAYSYIVYTMNANEEKGTNAISGLLVLKGKECVSDVPCRPHAAFGEFDANSLPQDSEAYSAMSF
jgi:hypothetical protein